MEGGIVFCDLLNSDTSYTAYRIGEIPVDEILFQSDRLKNLRALVGLDRGNTHFGSNLDNSMNNCIVVVIYRRIIILVKKSGFDQLTDRLMGKIRIDRTGSVPQQCGKMMHFSGFAAFQNHGHRSSLLGADQMLLQTGYSQKRRDRHMIFIHITVSQYQDISTFSDGTVRLNKYVFNCLFQACIFVVCDRNLSDLKSVHIHFLNL